jgi:uncharacterized membrane protein HdeD (DUF308 family)
VKLKITLILALLVFMIGAYTVTSEFSMVFDPGKPLSLFGSVFSLGRAVVAYADPVRGGPGSGD